MLLLSALVVHPACDAGCAIMEAWFARRQYISLRIYLWLWGNSNPGPAACQENKRKKNYNAGQLGRILTYKPQLLHPTAKDPHIGGFDEGAEHQVSDTSRKEGCNHL